MAAVCRAPFGLAIAGRQPRFAAFKLTPDETTNHGDKQSDDTPHRREPWTPVPKRPLALLLSIGLLASTLLAVPASPVDADTITADPGADEGLGPSNDHGADELLAEVEQVDQDLVSTDQVAGLEISDDGDAEWGDLEVTPEVVDDEGLEPSSDDPAGGAALESDDVAIVVQGHDDGLQYIVVLDDDADTRSDFAVEIDGAPAAMIERPDGSVVIGTPEPGATDGEILVGYIVAAPWAVDANGAAVPVDYETADGLLTLVVTPIASTEFAIVADPAFGVLPHGITSCGWTSCTYYLERQSTKNIRDLTSFSRTDNVWEFATLLAITTACARLPGALMSSSCSIFFGYHGIQIAKHSRKAGWGCLTVKQPHVSPGAFIWSHVKGGHKHCWWDADR